MYEYEAAHEEERGMNITVSQAQGRVPVAILHLDGQLDGTTFQALIEAARKLYEGGARDFLIDLEKLTYMSSAGMVALHTIALLSNGEALPDLEHGWSTMKAMGGMRGLKQEHVRLLNPGPEVGSVLDMVGFSQAFDIYTDKDGAVRAF
jgi:anti-anti-sigma factor